MTKSEAQELINAVADRNASNAIPADAVEVTVPEGATTRGLGRSLAKAGYRIRTAKDGRVFVFPVA